VPGNVPTPAAVPGAPAVAPAAVPSAAATPVAELVTITTDVLKATFDSQGGSLVRLELLDYSDAQDPKSHVVLMDRSDKRVYVAQTGLITTQPAWSCPTT
jgi:YidC/Oxa1 family membrane protein insertase